MKPDFIFLQEISSHQFKALSKNFPHFVYGKNVAHKNLHYGNAILSISPLSLINNVDISVGKFEKRGLIHSSINAPEFECIIISGDFNDWRCCQTSEPMLNKLGLKESFLDEHGSYAKTFPAWLPILKLDRKFCQIILH